MRRLPKSTFVGKFVNPDGSINIEIKNASEEPPPPVNLENSSVSQTLGGNVRVMNGATMNGVSRLVSEGVASVANDLLNKNIELRIADGKRDINSQWAVVKKNCDNPVQGGKCIKKAGGVPACVPQNSSASNCPHVAGKAVDVWGYKKGTNQKDGQAEVVKAMLKKGFCVLIKPEPELWHFEKPPRKDGNCTTNINEVKL